MSHCLQRETSTSQFIIAHGILVSREVNSNRELKGCRFESEADVKVVSTRSLVWRRVWKSGVEIWLWSLA